MGGGYYITMYGWLLCMYFALNQGSYSKTGLTPHVPTILSADKARERRRLLNSRVEDKQNKEHF